MKAPTGGQITGHALFKISEKMGLQMRLQEHLPHYSYALMLAP